MNLQRRQLRLSAPATPLRRTLVSRPVGLFAVREFAPPATAERCFARPSAIVAILAAALALAACRSGEAPPPAYVAGDPAEGDGTAGQDSGATQASAESSDDPLSTQRWFESADGRDALKAIARDEYEVAAQHLAVLMSNPASSSHDRAGAEVLLGLVYEHQRDFASAAAAFERARASSELAGIDAWLKIKQARALLGAKESKAALELLADFVASEASLGSTDAAVAARSNWKAWRAEAWLIVGDARSRSSDPKGAIAAYEAHVEASTSGKSASSSWDAKLKLAALLESDEPEKARALYESVALAVPVSELGADAHRGLERLAARGKWRKSKADRAAFETKLELATLDDLLGRHRYAEVVKKADALLARTKGESATANATRCDASFAKGTAIFKQRKRAAARSSFEAAAKACAKAGDDASASTGVKARYQAARGRYAKSDYPGAAKDFEALAKDAPKHSYADDALLLAGESWESAGKNQQAVAAWSRAVKDHPDGDMVPEIERRLIVRAFAESRNKDALTLSQAGLKRPGLDRMEKSKLLYFVGRAQHRLGDAAAARAAWLDAIEALPLGYASLLALSRLEELGDDALEAGLQVLGDADAKAATTPLLDGEHADVAARVEIFAQLGLGSQARQELASAGIKGWPAVAALVQAGHYDQSQRELADLGTDWRGTAPQGEARGRWELAHPLPYAELVRSGEQRVGVPDWLTYAIMQTESRFDPSATSFAGARGLLQLMPATARGLARDKPDFKESALYEPALNLELGQKYLSRLSQRWGASPSAVALAIPSYNAGAGAVDKWIAVRGDWELDLFLEAIPYDETRKYTQSVLGRWMTYRWLYASGTPRDRVPRLAMKLPARSNAPQAPDAVPVEEL